MAAAEDLVTAQSKPNPSNLATTFVSLHIIHSVRFHPHRVIPIQSK